MGQMIVDKVVQLLKNSGHRAEAAFPERKLARITEPVVAVSLEKADMQEKRAVVLVEVLAPQESGGYLCQKKALDVCAALEADGSECSLGSCEFLRYGDLFRVPVYATYRGVARANRTEALPKPVVVAGPMTLTCVCAFSATQAVSSANPVLAEAPWEFTVEEFFPWGVWNTLEPDEPFNLDVKCLGNVERYENCKWTQWQRIKEELGMRQIRKGKATGRILTAE